ncbi:MAG: glycosyltransferase [Actinomycetia bacterium]|nr:glycosyltransferase [Actinomycetes bacterium]
MSSPDVSIIIACYNEEPHLKQSVAEVIATMKATSYTYELIFVEDASQDRTAELIREICDSEANCRFL